VEQSQDTLRVDKWLWYARFFKTRSLAAKVVSSGGVRLNGSHIKKSSVLIKVGDTLTFAQSRDVRVIKIAELGARRGPASEAQLLYEDLAPISKSDQKEVKLDRSHPDSMHSGRPTKKTRRNLDAIKRSNT